MNFVDKHGTTEVYIPVHPRATITRCGLSATILFKLNVHILSLSNSHNNVASIQKNRGDKSHSVIVALHGKRHDHDKKQSD